MKIKIWIPIKDAVKGKVDPNNYSVSDPDSGKWVEVLITPDELQTLEDGVEKYMEDGDGRSAKNYTYPQFVEKHYNPERDEDWLVLQYNRNRAPEDWIKTREDIPYIYEKDDKGNVYRRRSGDYKSDRELMTNDEFKASNKPIVKNLKQLLNEYSTIQGKDFDKWWKSLSNTEQIELTKFWE